MLRIGQHCLDISLNKGTFYTSENKSIPNVKFHILNIKRKNVQFMQLCKNIIFKRKLVWKTLKTQLKYYIFIKVNKVGRDLQ